MFEGEFVGFGSYFGFVSIFYARFIDNYDLVGQFSLYKLPSPALYRLKTSS